MWSITSSASLGRCNSSFFDSSIPNIAPTAAMFVLVMEANPASTIMVCNSECFDGDTGIVSEEEEPVIVDEADMEQEHMSEAAHRHKELRSEKLREQQLAQTEAVQEEPVPTETAQEQTVSMDAETGEQ